MTADPDRLLPADRLRTGVTAVVAAAAVLLLLGAATWHRRTTSVDLAVDDRLARVRDLQALDRVVGVAAPARTLLLCVLLGVALLLLRRTRQAALCVVGPPAALVTAKLGQELTDRPSATVSTSFDAFPSGHATSAVAVVVLVVLLTRGVARHPAVLLLRVGVLALAGAVCLALTAFQHHFVTDVVAGAALAVGGLLLTALVLDALPSPSGITRRPAGSASVEGHLDPSAADRGGTWL